MANKRLERHKEEMSKVASFYVFLAGIFVLLIPIFILLFGITIGLLLFIITGILLYAQFRRKLQTIGRITSKWNSQLWILFFNR
ncbi:hypothetical protein [Geomicrobium sp. JCM 19038]|uniref:hypothetical protein n=1 Tax=Geomicrobium sp. JCM 19038 TaxID=1460635 RepID=UPI0005A79DEF|nr:hypothetical protein [Geomicrobium sp. JCM 19038]